MRWKSHIILFLLLCSMGMGLFSAASPMQGEVWLWGKDGIPLTVKQVEVVVVPAPYQWTPKAAAPVRIHQFTPPDLSKSRSEEVLSPLPQPQKRDGTPIDSGGIPSIKPPLAIQHPWVFAVLLAIILLAGILRLQMLNRGK